jgi:hypothetical protein
MEKAQSGSDASKERVLVRFHQFKGAKFADEELSQTFETMVKAGMIRS